MKRKTSIIVALLCGTFFHCGFVDAQETRQATHATLFGIGGVRQLDTYLSPLSYTGPQVQFIYESLSPRPWAQGRMSVQSLWQGNVAYTESPTGNVNNVGGDISYSFATHFNWHFGIKTSELRLLLGPQLNANIGALYNTRNGNNPAQAIAAMGLSASAAIVYSFHIRKQSFIARNQLDMPLLGAKFSPNYGQSYYEIFSEGNPDHNVCGTTPFNAPSLRNLLTIDIPFKRTTLRAGYLIDIRQSHLNQLKYHSYTHAFMIGWVKHILYQKPQRQTPQGFIM